MYIRKTTKISKGKTYTHYLLVESVHTAKGPRQRTICSLGSLGPGPLEQWHALARKGEASLAGQLSLEPTALPMEPMVDKAPPGPKHPGPFTGQGTPVDPEQVALDGGARHCVACRWRSGLSRPLRTNRATSRTPAAPSRPPGNRGLARSGCSSQTGLGRGAPAAANGRDRGH